MLWVPQNNLFMCVSTTTAPTSSFKCWMIRDDTFHSSVFFLFLLVFFNVMKSSMVIFVKEENFNQCKYDFDWNGVCMPFYVLAALAVSMTGMLFESNGRHMSLTKMIVLIAMREWFNFCKSSAIEISSHTYTQETHTVLSCQLLLCVYIWFCIKNVSNPWNVYLNKVFPLRTQPTKH